MLLILALVMARLWIVGKADLVLMIMRMADKNLINVHNDHKCKHCNYHG